MRTITHGHNNRTFSSSVSIKDNIWRVSRHDLTDSSTGWKRLDQVKYLIGRTQCDGRLTKDIGSLKLPWSLEDSLPSCRINEEIIFPEDIYAQLMLFAKKIAEEDLRAEVSDCVLAVPARFTHAQRSKIIDSAKSVGLTVKRMVNEPTAITVGALYNSKKTGDWMTIDIGGGTLDLAINNVSHSQGDMSITTTATSGNNMLGGNDFTTAMANVLQNAVGDAVPYDELWRHCELAKRKINLYDNTIDLEIRGEVHIVELEEYERACEPLYGQIRHAIKAVLSAQKNRLAGLILGGGASNFYNFRLKVVGMIQKELGEKKLDKTIDDIIAAAGAEIVATGNAIIAGSEKIQVFEVLCQSLGIAVQEDDEEVMQVMLPVNAPIPNSYCMKFVAMVEPETKITIYEGEHRQAEHNIERGSFWIKASRQEHIRVDIDVTKDSTMVVCAVSEKDEKTHPVQEKSRMTPEELEAFGERALARFKGIRPRSKVSYRRNAPIRMNLDDSIVVSTRE